MLNILGYVGKVKFFLMLFIFLVERKISIGDFRAYRMLGLKLSLGYWIEGWFVFVGFNRNFIDIFELDWISDL